MTIILDLKKRPTNDTLHIKVDMVRRVLTMSEAVAGRQLVKMFGELNHVVHDKVWLELIVNWAPPDGLPLTAMAPWLKLAERVASLDESSEEPFELSSAQAELIYKRLGDPEFKLSNLNAALATFILAFYEVMGKHPEDLTDELMFN